MAGGIITTGSFSKALWPGVNAWWGKAYGEWPVVWDQMFDKNTSRKAFEEDVGTTGFGLAHVKPEGQPIVYDSERQSFITRYVHTVYALGFIVTKEAFDDDLYDVVGEKNAKRLAFSMRQTKEVIGANIYNRAFNGSFVGGDGVSLLNAAHPNFAGGTFSNTLATPADLSEASLEQASIDISLFRNDRGLLVGVKPRALIIPPQLQFEAERILQSSNRVGTDNNDINALKSMGLFRDGIIVNPYLTDTDAWFIRTDVPDGMKYFERTPDFFAQDNDFDTDNAKFKGQMRFSFGWSDPRALYGSPGA